MSDSAAVYFRRGTDDSNYETSPAFIAHWDNDGMQGLAILYALELIEKVEAAQDRTVTPDSSTKQGDVILARGPLGDLEPAIVMLDFVRWYLFGQMSLDPSERIDSGYYLYPVDHAHTQSVDHGIQLIDLTALKAMDKDHRAFAAMMMSL